MPYLTNLDCRHGHRMGDELFACSSDCGASKQKLTASACLHVCFDKPHCTAEASQHPQPCCFFHEGAIMALLLFAECAVSNSSSCMHVHATADLPFVSAISAQVCMQVLPMHTKVGLSLKPRVAKVDLLNSKLAPLEHWLFDPRRSCSLQLQLFLVSVVPEILMLARSRHDGHRNI